eukprot:m.847902 g.847902  ORF g.847902 m.847902 type:complete len:60 (+) comp23487_c2_seq8:3181-3360(+)
MDLYTEGRFRMRFDQDPVSANLIREKYWQHCFVLHKVFQHTAKEQEMSWLLVPSCGIIW